MAIMFTKVPLVRFKKNILKIIQNFSSTSVILKKIKKVLDIGSNDGLFLDILKKRNQNIWHRSSS